MIAIPCKAMMISLNDEQPMSVMLTQIAQMTGRDRVAVDCRIRSKHISLSVQKLRLLIAGNTHEPQQMELASYFLKNNELH